MSCQLIPKGFRQRDVLHVSCSNKQRRDVLQFEACYPSTCQSHEEMQILALRSKDPLPLPEFVEFVGECEEDISVLAFVCCHLVACGRGCEGDIPLLCKHVESIESERALSSKDAIA